MRNSPHGWGEPVTLEPRMAECAGQRFLRYGYLQPLDDGPEF